MTSAAVQQQFGYFEPNFGHLFGSREYLNGATVPNRALIQPRAEGEIAFVLNNDLIDARLRLSDVVRSIDYAVCSIELLDSRITGWDIGPVDSVADNGSGGAHVLGMFPRRVTDCDLTLCGMFSAMSLKSKSEGSDQSAFTWQIGSDWPRAEIGCRNVCGRAM